MESYEHQNLTKRIICELSAKILDYTECIFYTNRKSLSTLLSAPMYEAFFFETDCLGTCNVKQREKLRNMACARNFNA